MGNIYYFKSILKKFRCLLHLSVTLKFYQRPVVLYCIALYCTVWYCVLLYCIVLYCIVLYCIVLYCIVLYCIVLYCIVSCCIVWRETCCNNKQTQTDRVYPCTRQVLGLHWCTFSFFVIMFGWGVSSKQINYYSSKQAPECSGHIIEGKTHNNNLQ